MDFLEFSRKRYSVRSYSDRPVEQDKINKILQAAMIAPTAVNYQPQKNICAEKQGSLTKNKAYYESTYNAPLVFLICADTERSWHSHFVEGYDSGEMDGSIVCTHMMLEAEDLGLGSCWVSLFDPKKVKGSLSFAEKHQTALPAS